MSDDDLAETALFKKLKATPHAPDPLTDQRKAQQAFDEVLSPLGLRAPGPEPDESNTHYLARLAEHAAVFGPEDRKGIDRRRLPPAALAEIAREDLAIAKGEIDRPYHSLRPGETREVTKTDRSGRPFVDFYNNDGPGFWMRTFMDPVCRMVSGGSRGIATEDRGGFYDFRKSQVVPEVREMVARATYADSAEAKIIAAYRQAGLEAPDVRKLLEGARR